MDDILEAVRAAAGQADPVDLAPAPEPSAPTQPASEPAEGAQAEAPSDGRVRDEHGRFAKTAETGQAPQSETAPPAATEPPQAETTRIPASLPAAIKAKFSTLEPDVRDAFVKLEASVQTAKAEWGPKGERLNRLDEVLSPRQEKFRLSGIDEVTAVQTLFAAQDLLERSPIEGLQYLARSYGVDLGRLAGQTSGQPQGQPDLAQHPALAPLFSKVQTLEQTIQQSRQAEEARQIAEAQATVDAFANDPKHLYFENVRQEVGRLLSTGAANDLAQAYEMAVWASPEIRPLLLQAQEAERLKATAAAAPQAKVMQARAAGVSVTGSRSGVMPPALGSTGNVEDDVRAAAASLSGRVA
jgi:hypothetical protein